MLLCKTYIVIVGCLCFELCTIDWCTVKQTLEVWVWVMTFEWEDTAVGLDFVGIRNPTSDMPLDVFFKFGRSAFILCVCIICVFVYRDFENDCISLRENINSIFAISSHLTLFGSWELNSECEKYY